MLSLGRIVISDLVVTDLFMHSLSGMILFYLAMPFFTLKYITFPCKIFPVYSTVDRENFVVKKVANVG